VSRFNVEKPQLALTVSKWCIKFLSLTF
jgi:hypothetical protein